MNYIEELESKLVAKKFSETYVNRCLTYAEKLQQKELPIIFDVKHLSKLMGVKYITLFHYIANTENFYKEYEIPKKTGGYRVINSPSLNLKKIQSWLLENILLNMDIDESAMGFKRNVSIIDNAKIHINKALVYNIDIQDFFPSISFKTVYFIFYNAGYTSEISYAFTKLFTYNGSLPQGSPSSPALSNIVCKKLDDEMKKLCIKIGANYSRYADDMTISTNDIPFFLLKKEAFKKTVELNGFIFNEKKERMQYKNQPQFVTGLLVNNGVRIKRNFKKEVEQHIYYCEKYGIFNHLQKIGMEHKSFYKEYLYGKVNFIKSIEPELGNSLLERLNKLNWAY